MAKLSEKLHELFELGQYAKVVEKGMAQIQSQGDSVEVWLIVGSALRAQGFVDQAKNAFVCALKVDSDDEKAQLNLIGSCLNEGNTDEAISHIVKYVPKMSSFTIANYLVDILQEAFDLGVLQRDQLPKSVWDRFEKAYSELSGSKDDDSEEDEGTDFQIDYKDVSLEFDYGDFEQIYWEHHHKKPYPIAHFLFDKVEDYKAATVWIEDGHLTLEKHPQLVLRPLSSPNFNEESSKSIVTDPMHLAEELFPDEIPWMIGQLFFTAPRDDEHFEYEDNNFYIYEAFSEFDDRLRGKFLLQAEDFAQKGKENLHFSESHKVSSSHTLQAIDRHPLWTSPTLYLGGHWCCSFLGQAIFAEVKRYCRWLKKQQAA